jgi:sporulation integral membrane protein YtvI
LERSLLLLIRLAAVILAGLILYLFFKYFWPLVALLIDTGIKLLMPLFIAYVAALIMKPVIDGLERNAHISRTWGAMLTLLVFLAAIGGLLFLLASNLIRELFQLYQQLSIMSQGLGAWDIALLTEKMRLLLTRLQLPPEIIQSALQNYQQAFNFLRNIVNILLVQVYFLVTSMPHYLFLLVVVCLASYFFARDYQLLKAGIFRTLPERWKVPVRRALSGLNRALQGYLKAELLMVTLTGLESLAGLSLMGIPYAYILALVATLLDFLPWFGIAILYVPWAIWLLFAGSVRLGIGLLLLYGIIMLVRQLIEPRLLARNMGLHPLTTLIAIYIGLMLLGFWGLMLGPAAVIVYKVFVNDGWT